jgi:glucose-1-phosphate adenylyltransferase
MKRTMALILAGGEGERLSILSSVRAKPAVPFGGKYRIIDFSLSNCVNSDITDVLVLTQYNPRSLNDHIGVGRPWDLDRNRGGIKLLQPYIARGRVAEWYRGTADAVLRNLNVIERSDADTIVVLAGDHIYKMDYQPFVAAHRRRRADVTIAVRRVPLADATRMGILAMDDNERVTDWQEKPKQHKSDLA